MSNPSKREIYLENNGFSDADNHGSKIYLSELLQLQAQGCLIVNAQNQEVLSRSDLQEWANVCSR